MFRKMPIMLTCIIALVAATASRTTAGDATAISPMGVWDLSGVDSEQTKWIATVVIRQGSGSRLMGHIDWIADDGSGGREYVNVTFSADSRIVRLVGTKVVFSEAIVKGSYTAKMSDDGAKLVGSWSGVLDDAVPGHWSATRINLLP